MAKLLRSSVVMVLAACGGGDDADQPIDAAEVWSENPPPPPEIQGAWRITRTVETQPPDCFTVTPDPIDVVVEIVPAPRLTVTGGELQTYDQTITETSVGFVTEDYPAEEETTRPMVIQHLLILQGSALVGSGQTQGDADQINCHYDITLAGTKI